MTTEEKVLRQEWKTPTEFFYAVCASFGVPTIDVAASVENTLCKVYLTKEEDGLKQSWFAQAAPHQVAWCNPGFSSVSEWIHKAHLEVTLPYTNTVIKGDRTALVLCLANPSTEWWKQALDYNAHIRLLAPRIQYDPAPGIKRSSNPREGALLVFRSKAFPDDRKIVTWYWKEGRFIG